MEIRASVPGAGAGSSNGQITFNPLRENPRVALLLSKGVVYLTWASSCDVGPYHGWVMAYDARTLKQLLKLRLQEGRLMVTDFFTPSNQNQLNADDNDLGSGGPLLLPERSGGGAAGLVFGGKQGVLYDANPNNIGGLQGQRGVPAVESFELSDGIYSAPAYWNGNLYTYASRDSVKQFAVKDGKVSSSYSARSKERSMFSGGTPTVSANKDRNGIVLCGSWKHAPGTKADRRHTASI